MLISKKLGFFTIALLFFVPVIFCQPAESTLTIKAPASFRARFATTKGDFVVEAYRHWSPKGVDRLYQLIISGFYTNCFLFRVEPGFVTQFGIAENKQVNKFWDPKKLLDEPAKAKNEEGIIAYARGGINDRATQLFINMVNNPLLDTVVRAGLKGYTPIGKIIKGMEVVKVFYSRYGRSTLAYQDSVYKYGNGYLNQHFPGLDRILYARLLH